MASELNESQAAQAHRPDAARFYSTRHRVSMGLMIFVVVAGLPIVGIPSLRQRLSTRVMALKSAISGDIKPATLQVGANNQPFPTEFERPAPPVPRAPELPSIDRVFTMKGGTAKLLPAPAPSPSPRALTKRTKPESAAAPEAPAAEQPALQTQTQPQTASPAGDSELKYQKGKSEQEAYDVLLKQSPAVAALVQGKDPVLKFKSWDAAHRGEDTYWVRLKFQSDGNADSEYIWQVKVQANQANPLNYNARSLGQ